MKHVTILLGCVCLVVCSGAFAADVPPLQSDTSAKKRFSVTGKVGDVYRELKLKDGRLLRDVRVKEILPYGLRVSHSDGGGRIYFSAMPDAMAGKYGLDPEQARVAEESARKTDGELQAKAGNEIAAARNRELEAAASQKAKLEERERIVQAEAARQASAKEQGEKAKADNERIKNSRKIVRGRVVLRLATLDQYLIDQDLVAEIDWERSGFNVTTYKFFMSPETSEFNFLKASRATEKYVVVRGAGNRFSAGQNACVYAFPTSEVTATGTPIYEYEIEMNHETKAAHEKKEAQRIASLSPPEKAKFKKELEDKAKALRTLIFDKKAKLLSSSSHDAASQEIDELKEQADKLDRQISGL